MDLCDLSDEIKSGSFSPDGTIKSLSLLSTVGDIKTYDLELNDGTICQFEITGGTDITKVSITNLPNDDTPINYILANIVTILNSGNSSSALELLVTQAETLVNIMSTIQYLTGEPGTDVVYDPVENTLTIPRGLDNGAAAVEALDPNGYGVDAFDQDNMHDGVNNKNYTSDEQTKLSNIETGATADQDGSEIKQLYEAEANTNAYTDAEKSKLDGIESGATSDMTGAEIKVAYENESNTNAFTDDNKLTVENTKFKMQEAYDASGFVNRIDSNISFSNANRTFSIVPADTEFVYYIKGMRYVVDAQIDYQISDVNTLHYLYIKDDKTIGDSFVFDVDILYKNNALIAILYWNVSEQKYEYFADSRHGISMSWDTRYHLRQTDGAKIGNGFVIGDIISDGSGDLDAHVQFSVGDGLLVNSDIFHKIIDGSPQDLSPIAQIPIYYKYGTSAIFRKIDATGLCVHPSGTGRASYNNLNVDTWEIKEADNDTVVLMHLFATNDIVNPIVLIMGTAQYATVADARLNAKIEFDNISGLLFEEIKGLGTFLIKTKDISTNSVKSAIQSTDTGDDYYDWRSIDNLNYIPPDVQITDDPIISGADTVNESSDLVLTITNYSATAVYNITLSHGSHNRTGDTITITAPSVDTNTSATLKITSVEPLKAVSNEITHNFVIANLSTTNDTDTYLDYSGSTINSTNFPTVSGGILNDSVSLEATSSLAVYTSAIIAKSDSQGNWNGVQAGAYTTSKLNNILGSSDSTYAYLTGDLTANNVYLGDGTNFETVDTTGISTYGGDGANNTSTTDSIPSMTANTSGGVTALSSNTDENDGISSNPHYYAFNQSTVDVWQDNATTGWIQIDFGVGNSKLINKYGMAGYSALPARLPKSWTLLASNTGAFAGEEVTLDTQADTTSWQAVNDVFNYWIFSNDTAYRFYRINITANNGDGTYLMVREIDMIEYDVTTLTHGQAFTPTFACRNDLVDLEVTFDNGANYLTLTKASTGATFEGQAPNVPNNEFETVLYTGNGATQTVNMQNISNGVDFAWFKARNQAYNHMAYDSIRDAMIYPNLTLAEENSGSLSFNADGINLVANTNSNVNTENYVAWCASLPNKNPANTAGTITSSTMANSFMSAFTWTGNDTVGATVPHGLGKVPQLLITKARNGTIDWLVSSSLLSSAGHYMFLNTTAAESNSNSAEVILGADIITLNGTIFHVKNTYDMVGYAFTSVEGLCKVGSYIGIGASGNAVDCGFEPAWVMIKRTDVADGWMILDNVRGTIGNDARLRADLSDAEFTSVDAVDFTNSGFISTGSSTISNASGGEYIYLAIAKELLTDLTIKEVFDATGVVSNPGLYLGCKLTQKEEAIETKEIYAALTESP